MDRTKLLDLLYRRRKTVDYSVKTVKFLEALSQPIRYDHGVPTEVDGDALGILRAGARE